MRLISPGLDRKRDHHHAVKVKVVALCALRAPDPTLRAWHAQRAPLARADSTCDKTDPNEGDQAGD